MLFFPPIRTVLCASMVQLRKILDKEIGELGFSPILGNIQPRDPEIRGKYGIMYSHSWPLFLHVKCCCYLARTICKIILKLKVITFLFMRKRHLFTDSWLKVTVMTGN